MTATTEHIPFFNRAFLNTFGLSLEDIGYIASIDKAAQLDEHLPHPFRNDFFIISFVTKGWLRIRVNFLEQQVDREQLLLLLPQTVFEMTASSPDLHISSLLVDRAFLSTSGLHANGKEVMEFFGSAHNVLQLASEECRVLNALLHVMQHQAGQADAVVLRKDIARHTFLAFMYELITLYRKYKVEVKATASRKEELTLRFIRLVAAHFREERSVQYYADQLFVTAKYLSTAVKEVTSKAPGALIDDAVTAEAKILLTNPAASIAEIAEALNFSDQSFFGKYFKKHTGYSPSEYRHQYWSA